MDIREAMFRLGRVTAPSTCAGWSAGGTSRRMRELADVRWADLRA